MDSGIGSQDSTSGNSSAIPRFSKLPTPRSLTTGAKPSSQIPGPSSQRPAIGTSALPSKPTIVKPNTSTGTTVPRLQKRASIASFSSTTSSASRDASSVARPAPASNSIANRTSRSLARPSTVSRASSARPSSVVTQQRRPLVANQSGVNGVPPKNPTQIRSLSNVRSAIKQEHVEEPPAVSDDVSNDATPRLRKGPRPSLSDRTIESLQTVPATPKDKQKSNFFNPSESPMGPLPRPGSSLSRDESNDSRPGTSDGIPAPPQIRTTSPSRKAPTSARPPRVSTGGFGFGSNISNTPTRRSASAALTSKLQRLKEPVPRREEIPSSDGSASVRSESRKSRTPDPSHGAAIKPPKLRPSLGDGFTPTTADNPPVAASSPDSKRAVSSSSAALRQQIAAAKAAARKERSKNDSPQGFSAPASGGFEMETHTDPFNQAPKDAKHILRNRINTARMDGKLNIAAMDLKHIPEEVLQMYSAASMEESNVNWAEVVDLTKLIAADNELEELDDAAFPDLSAEDLAADDQTEGNQFGGLELLDLHGNLLKMVPIGFRRLERLTTLNLSHNKLENNVLDIISQMRSLREIKLGHNALSGNLPKSICDLPQLETLDLQANRLLGLPEAIRELTSLKVLNVSGNQLTALPMEALQQIPLWELDASSNALIASLFPVGGEGGHATLRHLNVANNSLAALTFTPTLDLRQLRSLNVTNNHLTVLPSVAGWSELITLQIGDNKVSDFPFGFTSLPKLRNANFTGNEIRLLDPEISRMTSLENLILASNPLREKKFLTMSTANVKRDLKARIAPPEPDEEAFVSANSSPVTVIEANEPAADTWMLRANATLDLCSKDLSDDDNDSLGSFLKGNEAKQVLLRGNKISCIPPALWLGQVIKVLDLSDNLMSMDFLSDELGLPSLQELNLNRCRLSSLEPLITNLQAPRLQSLNISTNRLVGTLPALRNTFPLLNVLLAADNRFTAISAEALLGLHTVNLASNDIAQLPAEIGLLWDEGLRSLEIGSNAFRVPNYRILEKGTEATLRWLRDKLPASGLQGDL